MIERKLFYLCEVRNALDSGMTLQVLNDYGHLAARGWRITLPIGSAGELPPGVSALAPGAGPQLMRTMRMALAARSAQIVVIRERRHRLAAHVVRRLVGARVVSELHEAAFPRHRRAGSRRRFQRFLDGLDGLVLTNGSQRDHLLQLGFALPRQTTVLPNGVDYARFAAARPGGDTAPRILTYTGQFTPWKNCELLFAALAELDDSFRLRIAGGKASGDSAAYVADLARRHGVGERVDYLGFVHPRELVGRVIDGSSALLLPLGENDIARHATSPMKLIEYLATGLPVVAVGHPSVVALAGRDIVHLSTSAPRDFAAAIRAATTESAASRAQRSEKARSLARSFDHRERASRYDTWLSSLVPACAS